jgi:hypothetical protein
MVGQEHLRSYCDTLGWLLGQRVCTSPQRIRMYMRVRIEKENPSMSAVFQPLVDARREADVLRESNELNLRAAGPVPAVDDGLRGVRVSG